MLDQLSLFHDIGAPDHRGDLTGAERDTLAEARAILQRLLVGGDLIPSWDALQRYLGVTMGALRAESFRVLYLDRKNRLLRDEEMARGSVDHVPVYPREILRRAIELDACALILAHNHPSGDTTPSRSDLSMTKEIASAAGALGITLHDHVIIGGPDVRSLRAEGLI